MDIQYCTGPSRDNESGLDIGTICDKLESGRTQEMISSLALSHLHLVEDLYWIHDSDLYCCVARRSSTIVWRSPIHCFAHLEMALLSPVSIVGRKFAAALL